MNNQTKQTILIIDDLAINCELLAGILEPDFHTRCVSSGEEALTILRENTDFAAVLLDLIMPGVDGYEVLQYLHDAGLLDRFPVIVITAEPATVELRCLEMGAYDFILKPFDGRVVRKRVLNAVARCSYTNALEQSLAQQNPIAGALSHLTAEEQRFQRYRTMHNLSDRETEVLRCLLDGKSNAQIAEEFFITVNTTKFHVRNILNKCSVRNRTALLAQYRHYRV